MTQRRCFPCGGNGRTIDHLLTDPVCSSCGGTGYRGPQTCERCGGRGRITKLVFQVCSACKGTGIESEPVGFTAAPPTPSYRKNTQIGRTELLVRLAVLIGVAVYAHDAWAMDVVWHPPWASWLVPALLGLMAQAMWRLIAAGGVIWVIYQVVANPV